MHGHVQLVSGLPYGIKGEALLVDALTALGVGPHLIRLSDHSLELHKGEGHPVLVLLLPILGDNDLTEDLYKAVARLASCQSCRECAIVVVAHGDRHASDEFVTSGIPFSIKVSQLFNSAGVFEMLETKLDQFTAVTLAREIADIVDATSHNDVSELNCIARLLPKAPVWNARNRLLDFYDKHTGFSLLKAGGKKTRERIASHIQEIAPRILKMTNASLTNAELPSIGAALNAEVLDLSSNDFSWDQLAPHLSACRRLALAANELSHANLSALPRGIEHLYLHKNNIRDFSAMLLDVAQIKTLSLYRNRLSTFDWPSGQKSLTRLNLGANPIALLPDTLSDCTELESLGLARTNISLLPEWIFSLHKLRELDISYIEDRIPRAQIENLRTMRVSLITRPGLVIP